jgi:hypothetical protein
VKDGDVPVRSHTARQYFAFAVNRCTTHVGAVIGAKASGGEASAHVPPSKDHWIRNAAAALVPLIAVTLKMIDTQSASEFNTLETVATVDCVIVPEKTESAVGM